MRRKARQSPVVRKSRRRRQRAAQVVNGDQGRDDRDFIWSIRKLAAGGPPHGPVARTIRKWCSIWGVPALADTVSVRANARLRSSIARLVVANRCVELGPLFFTAPVNHREVLCHELAHAAARLKYGRRTRPHGPEWRDLVRAVGFEPRARQPGIRLLPSAAEQRQWTRRYEHRCPVCQSAWYARRPVTAWRCPTCTGAGLPGTLNITSSRPPRVQT
jgi:predicted SprT family Zn-dependent metalloprotease